MSNRIVDRNHRRQKSGGAAGSGARKTGPAGSGANGAGTKGSSMLDFFSIALRNVTRNKRRSLLNMIALTVGMSIMIMAVGWVRGYFTTLYEGIISFDTGHVQILHSEYLDEARRMPLDLTLPYYQQLRKFVAEMPEVAHAGGRIAFEAEVGNGREFMPMLGRAVDPRYEREITTIHRFIVEGSYFTGTGIDSGKNGHAFEENGTESVLLGESAARRLGVGPGDTVFIRVRDRYNAPNTAAFQVAGIFRLGYPLFDRNLILTDLSQTAELLRTGPLIDGSQAAAAGDIQAPDDPGSELHDPGFQSSSSESVIGVTHLVLRLHDGHDPVKTAEQLQQRLRGELDTLISGQSGISAENMDTNVPLTVYPWHRFARTLIAAVEADRGAFFLLMGILFFLIFLGILNSMSMTVRERGREIGTMRAIGIKKRELSLLLLTESALLALIAFIPAAVIGGAAAGYIQFIGFDISAMMPPDLPIPFGERFHGDYRLVDFLISLVLGLSTALLGSLLPVRRAVRLRVVETMRDGKV